MPVMKECREKERVVKRSKFSGAHIAFVLKHAEGGTRVGEVGRKTGISESTLYSILTDNGIQFAEQPRNRNTAWSWQIRFDMICEANNIEHRLT
jgi:predicted DNA-binding transcriptional regulator AlpA